MIDALRSAPETAYSEQYRALLAVLDVLVAHRDLSALFDDLASRLREVVDFDFLALALKNPGTNTMRLCAQCSDHMPCPLGTVFPVDDSPSGWVWRTQRTLIVPDVAEETRWPSFLERMPRNYGIRSFCDLPLTTARSRLGTLAFGSNQVDPYDFADMEFMQLVANQMALAVENTLNFQEIAELKDRLGHEKIHLEEEIRADTRFDEIIGKSPVLAQVLQSVRTVAPTDSAVFIRGETGTGKELIARAIHVLSERRKQTFVKINCAAIPTGLLESELFGHEKGAFTGAVQQRIGRFEMAHQGTLFLDEVGDIPLELQPKLLRVLQEQEFERLGSSRTLRVNARLVTATNRDLAQMVKDGTFRIDLYYRLNVFPVVLPPLRERRGDIPDLANHFMRKFSRRMGKQIGNFSTAAMRTLMAYDWPGNIRELENVIERAAILSPGTELRIPPAELEPHAECCDAVTLVEAEKRHILGALRECGWVLGGPKGAAEKLGMRRSTLQWKMRKLGIARSDQT